MIKKNDILDGEVIDFGSNGEGIIKRDDLVIFIPFSMVGETVKYKILKVEKNIAYGKLIEVITPSPLRIDPICPVFGKCGGCDLQHVKYQKTLDIKRENVKICFDKIANICIKPKETVPSDNIFGYRNKLQLPVGSIDGNEIIGFYARNSHRIVPIDFCPINPSWAETIIAVFKEYFYENGIKAFDSGSRTGEIKEITVKEIGSALIITVVSVKNTLKNADSLITKLKEHFSTFSLYLNQNTKDNNVIYGDKFILLYGEKDYVCEFDGIKYKSGVRSFSQVNDNVCKKLYETAVGYATENNPDIIVDAYSGAGLMTAMLAKKCDKAYGIEIIKEAVDCADEVAKMNDLSGKMINICGKTEEVLPRIVSENKLNGKISVVLDPPRKGCEYEVLETIIKSGAERIVYISCMPSTLSRDVGILTGTLVKGEAGLIKSDDKTGKYKVETVIPFDMFPQTRHVETLCVLTKI